MCNPRIFIDIIFGFFISLFLITPFQHADATKHYNIIPGKSIFFWDAERNYIHISAYSAISGNGRHEYINIGSCIKKEDNIYEFKAGGAYPKEAVIKETDLIFIKVINESTNEFQLKLNDEPWKTVDVYSRDAVVYVIGRVTGKIKKTGLENYSPIDLKKCWQADVDACTREDGKIFTLYDGISEDQFLNEFKNWKLNPMASFSDDNQFWKYSVERGDDSLKEILTVIKDSSRNDISFFSIEFKTNQRMLANMIYNKFKKNLSGIYNASEGRKISGEEHVVYTDKAEIPPISHRELSILSDYKKESYRVRWSCWIAH